MSVLARIFCDVIYEKYRNGEILMLETSVLNQTVALGLKEQDKQSIFRALLKTKSTLNHLSLCVHWQKSTR